VHKLLERQLRKLGAFSAPPRFDEFVAAVDAAYAQADRDRQMVERSLELASEELLERNRQLREDIERRKQLEIELAQAEKLRAVGQLASGIAHELNTPIQYVSDNLDFLQKAFQALTVFIARGVEGESGKARSKLDFMQQNIPGALEAALDGCSRVAEIVQAMKIFAHPDGGVCAPADINQALTSTLAVARNVVRYVADVELDLGELPLVECRIGDINQVFLNLIINAAHAVADRHGPEGRGKIRLSTSVRDDRVIVAVADDGCGIPEAVQPRIFEPFFTTKEVGKGTGQGLAISRSIVADRHGGSLSFETAPGVGTTFTVVLPVSAKADPCVESGVGQVSLAPPHGDVLGASMIG
jgi:signal transduction histidine kinase